MAESFTPGREPSHRGGRVATRRPRTPAVGRWLLALTESWRGSRSLARLREIEAGPYLSSEAVAADQWRKLSRLLAHCETRVPYYRDMFRSLGITSRDVRSLADFARLPVLSKAILRERRNELIRDDMPRESLIKRHSGGSTGVPMDFFVDREYLEMAEAGTYRYLQQCGWQPGEMIAYFWGGNEHLDRMPRWEFELRQTLRRMYQFDPFHSGPGDMERWARRWPRLGASVALGYASTIARFAHFMEARGLQLSRPLRGVFTTAETLYPPQREVIARVFGCRVFDCYGSSEARNIAVECLRGRMHVNADFVVLESERHSRPGEPSALIVTSLCNFAMPLVRYRNEDSGELAEGSCECGITFPLMRLGVARSSDHFVLPGGRVVHGEFFTHLMYGAEGIDSFQFHQTRPEAITLWVVPASAAADGRERAISAAVAGVEALAPGRIQVDVRQVTAIPLTPMGKHRFTRSDVSG